MADSLDWRGSVTKDDVRDQSFFLHLRCLAASRWRVSRHVFSHLTTEARHYSREGCARIRLRR